MIQNREKIGRLESLLARIMQRAGEPRVAPSRFVLEQPPVRETIPEARLEAKLPEPIVHEVPAPIAMPEPEPIPERITEPEVLASEVEEVEQAPVTVGAYVPEYRDVAREREEEPVVEAVSGEFAVADVAMELEELGPADEVHDEEDVVEIHVEEPKTAEPPHAEQARVDEVRISEPPESGRELVAAPHESARMAVAAPAMPDPSALELLTEDPVIDDPGPPESARNLKIAPAQPLTSDVFDLEPPARIEPEPVPFAPEKLVDVIRPAVMAADVAAFIEAARDPRPETFGILLDAALDL